MSLRCCNVEWWHATRVMLAAALLLAPVAPAWAQADASAVPSDRPTISIPRTADGPRVDGHLDDAAWQTAARVTDFVQQWPVERAPASERTEVYLTYDAANLYVGVYAHYGNPRLMRANRVDRDRTVRDDTVILYFDPFRDQQRAYVFAVNAFGVPADGILNGGTLPPGAS